MQITTLPVYSKLADPNEVHALFQRELPVQLSQHQLETYRALTSPDIDVVINTAMTGDGKSLAGLLPLLERNNSILGLFPTNELAQDQLRSSETSLPVWGHSRQAVGQVSGPILDEMLEQVEQLSRGELLLREFKNHGLLLSNPDILYAITQFFYQQRGRAATHIVGQLAVLFDQLTFDEFHVFDTTQINAVLTSLLFLYEQAHHPFKTLFLSATPDKRLLDPLHNLGFGPRLKVIHPQTEGWYCHGAEPGTGWRQILRECQLTFVPSSADEWLLGGVNDVIKPWFAEHGKGAKAAIIVNSVATALRLVDQLRPLLPGVRIEPNTGLNGRSTRKASYDADILVGTSTVDVGVDFHINLLIFEANSAATFMQRLGRLGRHANYTDPSGTIHPFNAFKAVALVPLFVYERLSIAQAEQSPKLHDGETLQRDRLGEIINENIFPSPTSFKHYARFWGRFQPAKIIAMLKEKSVRHSFADVCERLEPRYKQLTSVSVKNAIYDWNVYKQNNEELLVSEAQSFRGSTPFPCAVLKPGEGEVLSYDLFWLLVNVQLELLSPSAFQHAAEAQGIKVRDSWRKRQSFFFHWHGLLEQREQLMVRLTPRASNWGPERHHTAQILSGFTIDCGTHPFLNILNDRLITHPAVGLLVPDFDPQQVRRKCYLPGTLPLLPYNNASGCDPRSGTIAFGRSALLLDSALRYAKLTSNNDAIFC